MQRRQSHVPDALVSVVMSTKGTRLAANAGSRLQLGSHVPQNEPKPLRTSCSWASINQAEAVHEQYGVPQALNHKRMSAKPEARIQNLLCDAKFREGSFSSLGLAAQQRPRPESQLNVQLQGETATSPAQKQVIVPPAAICFSPMFARQKQAVLKARLSHAHGAEQEHAQLRQFSKEIFASGSVSVAVARPKSKQNLRTS